MNKSEVLAILEQLKVVPCERLESEEIEFKEFQSEASLHNSKELAEEISAIANLRGGAIIVGVRDSSKISQGHWQEQLVGFDHVDATATEERIKGKLNPRLAIGINQVTFEGRNYLWITVPRGRDTLITTSSGKVCIRDGRSSRPMTPYEIESAVKSLQTYDWSSEILDLDPVNALDDLATQEALEDFQQRRQLPPSLGVQAFLEAIGATRNGSLTKGGLLFLGRSDVIAKELGDFEYRFTWRTRSGNLIVNDVWSSCLWAAIKHARSHFEQCNSIQTFKAEGNEYRVPALDSQAFHEAFLNALVHRDYSVDGMVSVVYANRKMTITSPGGFYGGITADNILLHEPRHRNKALAKLLMVYSLVDRAGMGVLRMSIRSLIYGRAFPSFRELPDTIEVAMEAEFLRPGIFVITTSDIERLGIPELLLLNSVYEKGFASIPTLEHQLTRITDSPWQAIQSAVEELPYVELCGTSSGIYVRTTRSSARLFKVTKQLKASRASEKHVKLYTYLKRHEETSNSDLTDLLGHSHSSQTSRFLREATYVRRRGTGPSARWFLVS